VSYVLGSGSCTVSLREGIVFVCHFLRKMFRLALIMVLAPQTSFGLVFTEAEMDCSQMDLSEGSETGAAVFIELVIQLHHRVKISQSLVS